MISRRITFTGSQGASISAMLDLPGFGTPRGYALFAPCFTCSKELKSLVNINRVLAERGIVILRFDFTGLGESGGDFAETNFTSTVMDVIKAAEFLGANYQAPKLLLGLSLGGTAALAAASQIPSCRAVVTIGAPYGPEGLRDLLQGDLTQIERSGEGEIIVAERRFKVKQQFFQDISDVRMEDALKRLERPLLLLHAPADRVVHVDHAARIFAAAPHPKSLVELPDADHLLLREEDARYAGAMISAWMDKYI